MAEKIISILSINEYSRFILITLIIIITVTGERIFTRFTRRYLEGSSKIIKVDPTSFLVSRRIISALIYLAGLSMCVFMIPELKALAVSLFAGAGVIALMIGFAAQKAFSNIISGIFIAIFKPFRVGDIIKFGDRLGTVEDITLRHTVIRNFENKRYIVPNSSISEEVIENFNIEDERTCRYVDMSISYDSDIDLAISIMRQEILAHPLLTTSPSDEENKLEKPDINIKVMELNDYSIDLRAWAWAANPHDAFTMGCDLNKSIKEHFDSEGVEIPFPYRTIVMKKDIKPPRKKLKKNNAGKKIQKKK